MNILNYKKLFFFISAFVSFPPQNLYATDKFSVEAHDSDQLPKTANVRFPEPIQDILSKIENGEYIPTASLNHVKNNAVEEFKQLNSTMTSAHDRFDSWITLILMIFPKNSDFKYNLKIAKEKGEDNLATPASQSNLGCMYQYGCSVDKDLNKAINFYDKAAHQGNAIAQWNLGRIYLDGQGIGINIPKALKWYIKAANQGHATAQYDLGGIYNYGEDVDQDLAQALKWYLESFKNKNTRAKSLIKSLITFDDSTLTSEDENNIIDLQETLKDSIEAFLQTHVVIPDSEKEFLSNITKTYQQPGFMITCLQPINANAFKLSCSSDIKYHEIKGQSYLTFGHDNIEVADKLMTIFDQSHSIYDTISEVLNALTQIHETSQTEIDISDLAKDLKTQYISHLGLNIESQALDTSKNLTDHNLLLEKVKQEIKTLKQLQTIPQKLQDLLIEDAPARNKLYLQKNDYIGLIFED